MATVDRFRKIADRGRAIAARFVRPTTVVVVVEQWSDPIGTDGNTLTTTTSTTITPTPKVVAAGDAGSSAFGGGFASTSAGGLAATEYTIGPITHAYDGGGYAVDTLLPLGAVNKEVYLTLTGAAFDGSERFEVVPGSLDATRAHQFSFRVRRAPQAET